MPVTHEPWLVALSLVVAIQGAYVGLSLAIQVVDAVGLRRRLLIATASISLAVAVWAMHFIGMLAARLPFPVDYLAFPTLLSFLICVIVVGLAVFAATAGALTPGRLAAAAVFMGCGIVSMHYIGMTALHASAELMHFVPYVVASAAVAIATSGLALWLAGGHGGRPPLLLSATALGCAIAGMHYTAMQGLFLFPHTGAVSSSPVLSTDLLAIVVAVVAFLISGIFLLAVIPDRTAAAAAAPDELAAARRPAEANASANAMRSQIGATAAAAAAAVVAHPSASAGLEPEGRLAHHLPVEHDGAMRFVPVDNIVAVHANAHYTYVFDGNSKLFCPLPIGDVESRLDGRRFVRVHRSHIVALDRIVGLRRAGDNGLIELKAGNGYTVPVSRSRFGWLKSQVKLGIAPPPIRTPQLNAPIAAK
jgi:NO-binding membrane sensor protein with MHYT domain